MAWIRKFLQNRPLLAGLAFPANTLGLAIFYCWLIQTDVMFGHFSGPPLLLYAAECLLALGTAASIAWFVDVFFSRWHRTSDTKRPGAGIVTGIFLFLLLLPASLSLLFAATTTVEEFFRWCQKIWALPAFAIFR